MRPGEKKPSIYISFPTQEEASQQRRGKIHWKSRNLLLLRNVTHSRICRDSLLIFRKTISKATTSPPPLVVTEAGRVVVASSRRCCPCCSVSLFSCLAHSKRDAKKEKKKGLM